LLKISSINDVWEGCRRDYDEEEKLAEEIMMGCGECVGTPY